MGRERIYFHTGPFSTAARFAGGDDRFSFFFFPTTGDLRDQITLFCSINIIKISKNFLILILKASERTR